MSQSGVGSRLLSRELVNIFLFSDDIIIWGMMASDLEILKLILERWCKDFKMQVLPGKTKIIMPSTDLVCFLTDLLSGDSDLELVSQYKYLGVVQHRSPLSTFRAKGKSMVARAQSFKNVILRTSYQFVDRVETHQQSGTMLPSLRLCMGQM